MKALSQSLIAVIALQICLTGCCGGRRETANVFKVPTLSEVNEAWNWYWQIMVAEWELESANTNQRIEQPQPPKLQELNPRKLRDLFGTWKCTFEWNEDDEFKRPATIEFGKDYSFTIHWPDGSESGKWLVRANRVELYRIGEESDPHFRFWVISTSNRWHLVNADSARGLTALNKSTTPSSR